MSRTLEAWWRDFTHATRSLSRAPGFTLVVVVTLALAIGANTAIFSAVKVVLLEPLPFPNADRLVHLAGIAPGSELPDELGVPDELYFEYRENVPALEDLGLYGTGSSTARAEGQIDQLFMTRADAVVFQHARRAAVAGAAARRGRRRWCRRHQPLALTDVVRLRPRGGRPQLRLRPRDAHRDRRDGP